tara:strand:- start:9300 stop:10073 length:774 start_codon:yes stop_codon:yes gene_type:complete
MPTKKLTIITSTLNSLKTLPELENSLKRQRFQDFEWLIIDGGSTDGTVEFIQKHTQGNLICSEIDKGIYHAWNKSIPHINGEWVLFLGSDDYFEDDNILNDFHTFSQSLHPKEYDIIYGKVKVIMHNKKIKIYGKEINNVRRELSKNMCFCHQATFHNSKLFSKIGCFDESYFIAADYEYLLRAEDLIKINSIFFDRCISIMGVDGISSNKYNGMKSAIESLKARYKNKFNPISLPWLRHFIGGLFYLFLSKFRKNK